MKIKMKLLSDAIFGNGMSIPGGEDIAVLTDGLGFPYFKGSTLKGIFRETLEILLLSKGVKEEELEEVVSGMLGYSGSDKEAELYFSDLVIPETVKKIICAEIGDSPDEVLRSFTHERMFTAVDRDGIVKDGSLRMARCVNKGLWYTGEINCKPGQEELVKEVLGWIKWIGTMRSRGFGKVLFTWEEA